MALGFGGRGVNPTRSQSTGSSGPIRRIPVQSMTNPVPVGGVAGMPPMPAEAGATSGVSLQTQNNPQLDALMGRYTGWMDRLEGGTSRAMDIVGSKIRDAREGGRRALSEGQLLRGVGSGPGMGEYETETQRQVTGGLTDLALGREGMMGEAIRGGLGLATAGSDLALRQQQTQLQAQAAAQAANQANFERWLALLNAQRNSPLNSSTYTGVGF